MQAPGAISDAWNSLTTAHDREQNLRSIAVVRPWLTSLAVELGREPGEPIRRSPGEILGEWSSLMRGVAPPQDQARSIRILIGWLDCREAYLRAGGDPGAAPLYRNYTHVNVKGITDPDLFDGVPTPTARYWLEWWQKPERSWCGGAEDGRDPPEEARRVRREIEARERRFGACTGGRGTRDFFAIDVASSPPAPRHNRNPMKPSRWHRLPRSLRSGSLGASR